MVVALLVLRLTVRQYRDWGAMTAPHICHNFAVILQFLRKIKEKKKGQIHHIYLSYPHHAGVSAISLMVNANLQLALTSLDSSNPLEYFAK